MRSASGNKASRVCMGLLSNCVQALPGCGNRFFHTRRSCSAANVMDSKHVLQLRKAVEVRGKVIVDILQLLKTQLLQFTLLIERQPDCFSDDLVRDAKWHAFADEIRGRS